jgi:hypothetical protein
MVASVGAGIGSSAPRICDATVASPGVSAPLAAGARLLKKLGQAIPTHQIDHLKRDLVIDHRGIA